jgi:trimethylamine:corrinoid methyltransferase-like protein
MVHQDTIDHMRSTALLPLLANREMRTSWEERGRPDVYAKSMAQVKEILTQDNPAVLNQDVDHSIRSRFKDLVTGDSQWKNE